MPLHNTNQFFQKLGTQDMSKKLVRMCTLERK